METITAILAEMCVVFIAFYTERRCIRAIGIALTTVKTKCTNLTHFDFAESSSAIKAKMLVPLGTFDTVFTAGASFCVRIVHTAEYAQATIFTKVYSVFIQTFLTLLTNDTAFLTVIISGVAL